MKTIIVSEADSGQRLDRFLRKILPEAPLSLIYKMLRSKKIRLDGKKGAEDVRIESGDEIAVFLNDDELAGYGTKKNMKPSLGKLPFDPKWILFEDEHLLILNKPPGINVHPGDHKSDEVSLIQLVQDYLGGRYDTATFRPSLVHRLDRDTSGVLAIAKTRKDLNTLLDTLQSGKVKKTYLAFTAGIPPQPSGTISDPLLRVENAKGENKVRIDPAGQKAITGYRVVQKDVRANLALVELDLKTGRTHQIRVHLASIGAPVLGDRVYGNASENRKYGRESGVARQLLHAWKLAFAHPQTGKPIVIEAPMPRDMERITESLGFK